MDSFNIHNYFKRGKTVVLTLRHGDEETRQWADKDVADLLKLMRDFHPEFQNPRRKKKEVWDDVANELYKSGYTWSSEDCRKKWSNMIRTFRGIEEQRNDPTYSNKRLKWPLYDSMLQLLTLENADAFPEASTVIQIINSDPNRSSANASSFSRKMSNYRTLDTFTKSTFPTHHQVQAGESVQGTEFLDSHHHRDRDDSINLVSEADLMEMGVALSGHHDPLTTADVQGGVVNGMESSIIFTQPTRYKTQPDLLVPSSSTTSASHASSVSKTSLAVRAKKKPLSSSKRKKSLKENKVDDSIDTLLAKFIESTSKQNEEILAKMSTFHDNALALMRERNVLLRDIRDSLQNSGTDHNNESLVNVCHGHDAHALDDDPQNTLTLHVGPAFSIASNEHTNSGTQLNPTLVLSNPNATSTSTISTFQLEDGTVLSSIDSIDTSQQDKTQTVLSNLGSFAQSVLPDVSLLHPSLVSVVTETVEPSADMALAMQNAVLGRIKQSSD